MNISNLVFCLSWFRRSRLEFENPPSTTELRVLDVVIDCLPGGGGSEGQTLLLGTLGCPPKNPEVRLDFKGVRMDVRGLCHLNIRTIYRISGLGITRKNIPEFL